MKLVTSCRCELLFFGHYIKVYCLQPMAMTELIHEVHRSWAGEAAILGPKVKFPSAAAPVEHRHGLIDFILQHCRVLFLGEGTFMQNQTTPLKWNFDEFCTATGCHVVFCLSIFSCPVNVEAAVAAILLQSSLCLSNVSRKSWQVHRAYRAYRVNAISMHLLHVVFLVTLGILLISQRFSKKKSKKTSSNCSIHE